MRNQIFHRGKTLLGILQSEQWVLDAPVLRAAVSVSQFNALVGISTSKDPIGTLVDIIGKIRNAEEILPDYESLSNVQDFWERDEKNARYIRAGLDTYEDAVENLPLITKQVGIEIESLARRIEKNYVEEITEGIRPSQAISLYQELRAKLPDWSSPNERIDFYLKSEEAIEDIQSQLLALGRDQSIFPETLAKGDHVKLLVKRIEKLVSEGNPDWSESYFARELRDVQAYQSHFEKIEKHHEDLLGYRAELTEGVIDLKAKISMLKARGNTLEDLESVFNTFKGLVSSKAPIETDYFVNEESAYKAARGEFDEALALVLTNAKELTRGKYSEILAGDLRAKNLGELREILTPLDEQVEELDGLAAHFSLLGDKLYLTKTQSLRGKKLDQLREVATTLDQKRTIDLSYNASTEILEDTIKLREDIDKYGISAERMTRIIDLANTTENLSGRFRDSRGNKYLTASIGDYESQVRQIQGQIATIKNMALEILDVTSESLAEKMDIPGLEQVVKFYESFPEEVEGRVIATKATINALSTPKPSELSAATYFSNLRPRNRFQSRLSYTLDGGTDRTYIGRLKTFIGHLGNIPPPSDVYEVEFAQKLRKGILLIAASPIMKLELRECPENEPIIAKALERIDAYATN